jgi:type II secretory pathway pseudopilin PulG
MLVPLLVVAVLIAALFAVRRAGRKSDERRLAETRRQKQIAREKLNQTWDELSQIGIRDVRKPRTKATNTAINTNQRVTSYYDYAGR